jgi:hypothetical protein
MKAEKLMVSQPRVLWVLFYGVAVARKNSRPLRGAGVMVTVARW